MHDCDSRLGGESPWAATRPAPAADACRYWAPTNGSDRWGDAAVPVIHFLATAFQSSILNMNAEPSSPPPSDGTPAAVAAPYGDPSPDHCGIAPARILVVDDDPDVRRVLGGALRLFNYSVDTAGDGAVGWEALCANSYDLVITDHMMPKLTGLDLLRRLRTVRVDLPCILISGDLPSMEADLPSLLWPGRAVDKPVRLETLVTMVRSLLAAHPIRPAAVPSKSGRATLCPV